MKSAGQHGDSPLGSADLAVKHPALAYCAAHGQWKAADEACKTSQLGYSEAGTKPRGCWEL